MVWSKIQSSQLRQINAAAVARSRRRQLIVNPLLGFAGWMILTCCAAAVYYELEAGPERERAWANDQEAMAAGLLSYPPAPPVPPDAPSAPSSPPPPPSKPPSPPPLAPPPDLPPPAKGPRAPGASGAAGKGSGQGSAAQDEAAKEAVDCTPPEEATAASDVGGRTANLTSELESLRNYITLLEDSCKSLPSSSDDLNWTPYRTPRRTLHATMPSRTYHARTGLSPRLAEGI